jgi:hypothetical protein
MFFLLVLLYFCNYIYLSLLSLQIGPLGEI